MNFIEVKAENRSAGTKAGVKQVRKEGMIPAVIYGGDNVTHCAVHPLAVRDAIYTKEFHPVMLELDGKSEKCIVKDIQFHPVTDQIVHIDFLRMIDGHPIKVSLPLRFDGVAPGVREGGKLIPKLRKVLVKTVPEKLVSELKADVSSLTLGQSIRTRDIDVPEGIEVMNPPAIPIASVEIPRALRSAEAKAAGLEEGDGEEGAEGDGEEGATEAAE